MSTVVDFRLGDVVQLRKVHPCGGFRWQVVRLGADIGLRCQTCGRRVLLDRRTLEKRTKAFVARGGADDPLPPPRESPPPSAEERPSWE